MAKAFILSLLCIVLSGLAEAQFWQQDSSFNNVGQYDGDTGICKQIAVQPDGKIIIAGGDKHNGWNTAAIRFNANGSFDNNFANNGRFIWDTVSWKQNHTITSLCLQPDGKIVLGGTVDSSGNGADFLLIRLNPNGTADSSFGNQGYVMIDYTTGTLPNAKETLSSIALQADGKILAYGSYNLGLDTLQVVRFHTDGSVDSNFGINGRVKIFAGIDHPVPHDMAIMNDGRIVFGATANIVGQAGDTAFTAIRLLSDGHLDTNFNHTGIAYTNANLNNDPAYNKRYSTSMRLQPDGKVLLAGYGDSLAIVRFDTLGNLDNSFGTNGLSKLLGYGKTAKIIVQLDGKIIVGTHVSTILWPIILIYRVYPDGTMDSSFGENILGAEGFIGASGPGYTGTFLETMALQADGKLLVGGYYDYPSKAILFRFTEAPTASSTINLDWYLDVYPNPVNDYLYIKNNSRHHIGKVSLYSIDGKVLRTFDNPSPNRLSIGDLLDGIYYLRVGLTNNQYFTKKIIINKE